MLALAPSLADLPFRGNGNYLHWTDLYPALTELAHKTVKAGDGIAHWNTTRLLIAA